MYNMKMYNKKRVQAQRKFAQGTVVSQPPPTTTPTATTSTSNERRTVESYDRTANIYYNNTSASRLLDEVAFRHPGMHRGNMTVSLSRFPESVFKEDPVSLPRTSRSTVNNMDRYLDESQCVEIDQNTYFLRSRSKFNNVTKEGVTKTPQNNQSTLRKRGRPRNSSSSQRRVKLKPLRSPVYETCSEDDTPLSKYRRSKRKITAPYIPKSIDERILDDITDFPNLGDVELRSHDSDLKPVIKTEDRSTTSNDSGHLEIAASSRPSVPVIVEAPVFYPTEEEFNDPLEFYNKIQSVAMEYGICKVVPPESFETKCSLKNLLRVSATHQYIGRLFKRWGSGTREMCAIRAHLASHSVVFSRPPLIDGLEVDLPKMFQTVQKYGGFLEVTQKQLWTRVAEAMNYFKILNPGKRLDQLYVKYLLPYDIMKPGDRDILNSKIESLWLKKHHKLLKLAKTPFHFEKFMLVESDSSSDEEYTEEEETLNKSLYEIPNNDKTTRPILLTNFHKINDNAIRIYFPQYPNGPPVEEVEEFYWSKVLQATDHICVYTASVDTTDGGHGFTTEDDDIISKHKWNLKNFQHNETNIFKALGPLVSVTTPVLNMGMLFSTHCWHKDPHGLPWVEYHHEGQPKIWYGIPDMRSNKFRKTVEKLCPTVVQNKALWLSSDLLMIPPDLLLKEGVSLTKTIQNPREYIFVLPNAYTSSICTGFTVSESVYFAQEPWLYDINEIFLKLHESCEPMIFPPEQLLIALGKNPKTTPNVNHLIYSNLLRALESEIADRFFLESMGVEQELVEPSDEYQRNWNCKDKECDICKRPLFFSKITGRFREQFVTKICIKHCRQILERHRSKEWSITLVIYISDEYLRSLTDNVSKKLDTSNNLNS